MNPWQPALTGPTLKLRPLREDDYEPLFSAASDPKIWELHPDRLRHTRERFDVFFRGGMDCQGGLAILDDRTGEIIGSSRYTDHSLEHSSVEIGYTFLTRAYWGGKANRELKQLMLEHAFKHIQTAYFVVGKDNLRSRQAMTKIGGKLLPSNEGLPVTGDLSASVVFRIEAQDWKSYA